MLKLILSPGVAQITDYSRISNFVRQSHGCVVLGNEDCINYLRYIPYILVTFLLLLLQIVLHEVRKEAAPRVLNGVGKLDIA